MKNMQSTKQISQKDDIKEIREKKKDFYIHSDKTVKYGIVDEVL